MDNFQSFSPEQLVKTLVAYANTHLSLPEEDNTYCFNMICGILRLQPTGEDFEPDMLLIEKLKSPADIVNPLLEYAIKNGATKEESKKSFGTFIISLLIPAPSKVIDVFNTVYDNGGIKTATDWFYDLNIKSDYIPFYEVSSNIKWKAETEKGAIDITINTSKPEKKVSDIAKALKVSNSNYPKCPICPENCGFFGNDKIQPRQTLRTLPLYLNDEEWFFQYSPYNYFDEHCIVFSKEHAPMKTSMATFNRLFDFVDLFPHYFIGSNADLPIVGGSILTHDHFQGGNYGMPMFSAQPKMLFSDNKSDLKISIIDWNSSCVRLEGRNRADVFAGIETIYNSWLEYSNPKLSIINSKKERHNAITAIARMNAEGEYCAELILRNNCTDDNFPDGVFHVNPKHFNIKQENIGLIEAMGVFILPGRIAKEAREMSAYLTGEKKFLITALKKEDSPLVKHADMIKELLAEGKAKDAEDAGTMIETYINKTCNDILKNIAVFKDDAAGNIAFIEFMVNAGFELKR